MAGSQGQFLRTERGRPMLCLRGYLYTKHCSNEVLAILPKESVIKRTINNHKALPPIELVGVNSLGQIPGTYNRTLAFDVRAGLKIYLFID